MGTLHYSSWNGMDISTDSLNHRSPPPHTGGDADDTADTVDTVGFAQVRGDGNDKPGEEKQEDRYAVSATGVHFLPTAGVREAVFNTAFANTNREIFADQTLNNTGSTVTFAHAHIVERNNQRFAQVITAHAGDSPAFAVIVDRVQGTVRLILLTPPHRLDPNEVPNGFDVEGTSDDGRTYYINEETNSRISQLRPGNPWRLEPDGLMLTQQLGSRSVAEGNALFKAELEVSEKEFKLNPGEEFFLLVMSDGVEDQLNVLTSAKAKQILEEVFLETNDLEMAAKKLIEELEKIKQAVAAVFASALGNNLQLVRSIGDLKKDWEKIGLKQEVFQAIEIDAENGTMQLDGQIYDISALRVQADAYATVIMKSQDNQTALIMRAEELDNELSVDHQFDEAQLTKNDSVTVLDGNHGHGAAEKAKEKFPAEVKNLTALYLKVAPLAEKLALKPERDIEILATSVEVNQILALLNGSPISLLKEIGIKDYEKISPIFEIPRLKKIANSMSDSNEKTKLLELFEDLVKKWNIAYGQESDSQPNLNQKALREELSAVSTALNQQSRDRLIELALPLSLLAKSNFLKNDQDITNALTSCNNDPSPLRGVKGFEKAFQMLEIARLQKIANSMSNSNEKTKLLELSEDLVKKWNIAYSQEYSSQSNLNQKALREELSAVITALHRLGDSRVVELALPLSLLAKSSFLKDDPDVTAALASLDNNPSLLQGLKVFPMLEIERLQQLAISQTDEVLRKNLQTLIDELRLRWNAAYGQAPDSQTNPNQQLLREELSAAIAALRTLGDKSIVSLLAKPKFLKDDPDVQAALTSLNNNPSPLRGIKGFEKSFQMLEIARLQNIADGATDVKAKSNMGRLADGMRCAWNYIYVKVPAEEGDSLKAQKQETLGQLLSATTQTTSKVIKQNGSVIEAGKAQATRIVAKAKDARRTLHKNRSEVWMVVDILLTLSIIGVLANRVVTGKWLPDFYARTTSKEAAKDIRRGIEGVADLPRRKA